MKEDFLYYLWQYKRITLHDLRTVRGEKITIQTTGLFNENAGPDFFNAKIRIADQLWAGNVEIHVRASDWYVHHHENDPAYDNVILHVVWEYDTDLYRKDGSVIPVLELRSFVNTVLLAKYRQLFLQKKQWIPCEKEIGTVDPFVREHWLERLYFERLVEKSVTIKQLLHQSSNDWEATLFKLLARNFGVKINADAFASMAESFPFSLVRKLQAHPIQLEALFLGQASLLTSQVEDVHLQALQSEHAYAARKFNLVEKGAFIPQFFRLRPMNFPTIRLSQLAQLYSQQTSLFSAVIEANTLAEFYKLFSIAPSAYWKSHYTFGTPSRKSDKRLSKNFVDILLINTVIPLKFCYAQHIGKDISEEIMQLLISIKAENNSVIKKFSEIQVAPENAMQTQALLQMKVKYCDNLRCLQCDIGNHLLKT